MLKRAKVRVYGTLVHISACKLHLWCQTVGITMVQFSATICPCIHLSVRVASVWMFEDQLTASLQEWDKYGTVQQLS